MGDAATALHKKMTWPRGFGGSIATQRQRGCILIYMISDTTRDEVNLLSEKASLDLSQLNYRAAAAKFGEAASLLTSQDPQLALALMIEQAKALWDQGYEFGDNEALSEAIAIYQRGLSLVPVTTFPLLWAETQRHLGIALGVLGERESGTGRLEEAP